MQATNDKIITEVWKPIPSLNNKYEASNKGRFRNAETKKVLKQFENSNGYMILQARPEKNKTVNVRVHQAVAEAFLGQRPYGYVVNHKDGNKHNNHVTNLEYVTSGENNKHALDNGLRHTANMKEKAVRGEKHCRATITEDDVYRILKARDETGYGCRKLSKMLGISRGVINPILNGRSWKETVEKYYKEKEI